MQENNNLPASIETGTSEQNLAIEFRLTRSYFCDLFRAITVRCLFLVEASVLLVFVKCLLNNYYYLFLTALLVVIIADGFYVVIKRKGKEYKWFSISVASFSILFIICVWVIVFNKLDTNNKSCQNSTLTSFQFMSEKFCFTVSFN